MFFENDFFEEEVREGFTVSSMMKRAWAACLEVYDVIRNVCDANGIRHYACGGTLLGAIRHKGFIPWDDDMDICMMRDDYMKFIEIAPSALPEGFVLAGMYADDKRLWLANQTMQARVIADEEFFSLPAYMNRFHGYPYPRIGIDIFPYEMLDDDYETIHHNHRIYFHSHVLMRNWDSLKHDGTLKTTLHDFERVTGSHIDTSDSDLARQQIVRIGDKYGTNADRESATRVTNITELSFANGFPSLQGYMPIMERMIPIELYGEGVDIPFENTTMRVGSEYLQIVERIFGPNYMTPVKFAAGHEYPFYKNQEAEFRRMLDESGVTVLIEDFCKNWHLANGGN